MSVTDEAQKQSVQLLRDISTEKGFVASPKDHDNYHRVWGRDGVICSLAALATGEEDLIQTARATLETLSESQDKTGRIISNITLDGEGVSFGTTVGRIDSTLWYVIGMLRWASVTGDEQFFENHRENIDQALFYLECLELNGRGLIYIPQGADWADEYVQEGYVLFDQLLYLIALSLYGSYTGSEYHTDKARHLRDIIRINYLPQEEHLDNDLVYHKALYEKMVESFIPPTPIPSFSPNRTYHHKDIFAISLFMILELADKRACREIVDNIGVDCTGTDFPIAPAFCPVIHQDEARWKYLENNYLYRFKNKPFEFHNGGRWPLVHGFYLASRNNDSREALDQFADVLAQDGFLFPEFYHGRDCTPMGVMPLGLSAAGYLIAHHAVKDRRMPFGNLV